ncbi:hypothetical protein [Streptomyces flaveolus]|uniref:hypothetical protein n=1 Tax=Streptomyces flaveolus TaxID=67297 RepID=UPI003675650E
MTDRDVLVSSKERDRVNSLPADRTSGVLLHADGLGGQREFTHDLHNEPQVDRSARGTLLHRFVVGPTADCTMTQEIDLAVTVAATGCTVRAAVDAHLDHPVAHPGGPTVLWERRVDDVGPARPMRFLGPAVEDLSDPEYPFGPLITLSDRTDRNLCDRKIPSFRLDDGNSRRRCRRWSARQRDPRERGGRRRRHRHLVRVHREPAHR